MQVGDLIGTVFGIASFVCEIATPIITCINPALGAAIGTGMSAATGILGGIKDAVEGRPGGIYNAIDEVAGIIPSELQARLKAGWSEAGSELGDVYSEIEAAVVGWRDAGGQFMQQVGDLNGGSDFFQVMTEAMTPEESYKTMVHDIYSVTSRQVLKNFNIEDAPFKVGWVGNYTHVPPEWKDNPFPKIDPSRYYGALGSTGVPFIGPGL